MVKTSPAKKLSFPQPAALPQRGTCLSSARSSRHESGDHARSPAEVSEKKSLFSFQ